jgi:hypothetical protein
VYLAKKFPKISLANIAVLILYTALLCIPANAGLTVSGGKYLGEIAPGTTYIHTITIKTDTTDTPIDVMVDLMGFGQGADLSYLEIPPAEDTGQYSARSFISIDPFSFTLKPGEAKMVKVKMAVPSDIGAGGRYAMINIHTNPVGTGTVSIASAFGVPVMVTIKGQPIIETGSISEIKSVIKQDGKTAIVTTFKNTGNHHYYGATNSVTVTDANGKQLASVTLDPSLTAIIPEATVMFEAITPTPLQPGVYSVDSKVTLPNGTILDSKKMTVEVGSVPAGTLPIAPAQVTSAPRSGLGLGGVDEGVQSVNTPVGVKTTYSPGPSPLITCGVCAAVLLLFCRRK